MHRPSLSLFAIVAIAPVLSITSHAQSGTMTHHVRDTVRNGQAQQNGRLPATQTMNLDIVLPLRDAAGLDSFLAAVNNPASPQYRQFVTPQEFTARFGPTQADYDAVVSFAQSNGFTVTGGSRDGMDVQVSAPVSAVESAFHIAMRTYKHPKENRNFYGPDTEPTASLPLSLWHVSGLDNYSIPHPLVVNRNDYAAANHISPDGVVSHATSGSGPGASFLGSDMRAAYYGSGPLTGAGQSLGLLEYYGTDLADLTTYYNNIGQTNNVPVTLFSVDGSSTSCLHSAGCDDTEQELDLTQALGMAPGLSSLVMYIGRSDTSIISAMTTHNPLPGTIGCSWGWTPVDPGTLDPYFKKMAAQGQNFFVASGDTSTWATSQYVWPADDAYVVSVGGTDLTTASAGGAWRSETAWVDSGGGITGDNIAIPAWQAGVINAGNKGSTTLRNGPDVSANANFTFYTCQNQSGCMSNTYGGTSFAAPMWAGYMALVNQQSVANGQPRIGFLDPIIYSQNVTASYGTDFHDITSGTSGSYSAVTGYDLVTGWGSPNAGLIAALTGSATQTPSFTIAAWSMPGSVVAGSNANSTITTAVSGGFSSDVGLTVSGAPSGVTVSLSPSTIAGGSGSSVATFAVASTTPPGTYNMTTTGTGGGLVETASGSLTVTAPVTGDFSISASSSSSSSITAKRSSSVSTTVSTVATGGFNSAVSLTASAGNGLSVSFSPTSIATGSGSSTVLIVVSKTAGYGNHMVTVTGTGGGVTHTATFTVKITK
ncbi:MAG TPA: S53 family serine peptidase [Acidobacteriaceae bacterium]